MLGVGGAAAIADDQELVARAQRGDDDSRDFPRGGEQAASCVARSSAASESARWAPIGSLEVWLKRTVRGYELHLW